MAFLIVYHKDINRDSDEFKLPIDEQFWQGIVMAGIDNEVFSVVAYDEELEAVRKWFDNLPIPKGNWSFWRGEMANFLCANFPKQLK